MLNQMTPEWNICARRAVPVCSLCHFCILLCPFPIYLVLELTLGHQSKLPIFPGDVLFGALGFSPANRPQQSTKEFMPSNCGSGEDS